MNARSSAVHSLVNPEEPLHRSIIVTTQPELFEHRLSSQLGRTVAIFDNSEDAIHELQTVGCNSFYADFRQLSDRWTGQRFLRFIRDHAEYAHVEFWLMAEHWHATQEEWAIKCGAAGMLKRSPQVLATRILGEAPQLSMAVALQFDTIDAIFGRFAGPMRPVHVKAARDAVATGRIEPTRDAYVQELSLKLSLEERRDSFLKALRVDSELPGESDTTQPGDPWMTEVNKVFRRYAGALGARIIISKALEDLEYKGKYDRSFYVSGLSDGLVNPVRRQDFISAAREARLIS